MVPDPNPTPTPIVRRRRTRRRETDTFWNVLTLLFVVAIVGVVVILLSVYNNPASRLNPFPPPTMPVALVLPSQTPKPVTPTIAYTPTITKTVTPSPTLTLVPTETRFPTRTATVTPVGATPTKPSLAYPFVLQNAPAAIASTVFHPDTGCNWQGVAGQVFDLKGSPLIGVSVRINGVLDSNYVDMLTLSGLQKAYGESGYEFILGTKPAASARKLSVQLFDQSSIPLSDRVLFDTFTDCQKNLVLINFKQVK